MEAAPAKSMVTLNKEGWVLSAVIAEGKDILVRLFNEAGDSSPLTVSLNASVREVAQIELNGKVVKTLTATDKRRNQTSVKISAPRFGIRTIKFAGALN